jgi:hypothetical protein
MKKQIQTLLQQTPEHYEMKTLVLWMKWCESVTGKQNEFQMVLCNPSINKWFHAELMKWENEFLLRVKNYPDASLIDLHTQYHACIVQLFNVSPRVLVQEVFRQLKAAEPTNGELATLEKATSINHFQLN